MKSRPLPRWRKIAVAAWRTPTDPQIYGDLEIDAAAMLAYVQRVRRETGVHLTMTHLVGRAIAHALAENPGVNGIIRRGRFLPREQVDVFFIATVGGGKELSGVKVTNADQRSAVDVAREMTARVAAIAAGADPEFGRTKKLLAWAPVWLLRGLVRLAAWLTADHDRDYPSLGLPRQPFGSAMVTSVGMFGIRHGYAPLATYYRVPFLVLVGEVTQRPVALDGTVLVRPILPLTATIDHRYVDVSDIAHLAASMREYCHDPAAFEPPLAETVPVG